MSGEQVHSLAQIANFEIDISDRSLLATPSPTPEQPRLSTSTPPTDDDDSSASSSSSSSASSEDDFEEQPRERRDTDVSTSSRVSFGGATNLVTGSFKENRHDTTQRYPQDNYPQATYTAMDSSDYDSDDQMAAASLPPPPPQAAPRKSALKNSTPGPIDFNAMDTASPIESPTYSSPPPPSTKKGKGKGSKRENRALTMVSAQYDFEGKGYLDPVQQAMRDQDIDNSGNLDQHEVHKIIQNQLKNVRLTKKYRKVAAALVCLVGILALSNFGTSWATAILSKEMNTDAESGTIQSKETGEVMGFQDVAFTLEMDQLDDDEFEQRRLLVDAEMHEDIDHEDHQHRKLGKKNKKNKCNCSKISYDHGKISEKDLLQLRRRCEGGNIVNVMTGWKDLNGSKKDFNYEQICGPGTVVQRKGKKKKNKSGTKVKVVDEVVSVRRKTGGRAAASSFGCKRGQCYASGAGTMRRAGHPCNLARDYEGASECDEGLVCYDPDGNTYGTGTCTKLQRYAGPKQVCQVDFGVDACDAGYACYNTRGNIGNGKKKSVLRTGIVSTGLCDRVVQRSNEYEVCDVSYGANACVSGFRCLGVNGKEIRSSKGFGYCAAVARSGGGDGGGVYTGRWYIDDQTQTCVQDCQGGSGAWCDRDERESWEDSYGSALDCCNSSQMSWMPKKDCVPGYNNWNNNGGRNNNGGNNGGSWSYVNGDGAGTDWYNNGRDQNSNGGSNGWNNNGGNNGNGAIISGPSGQINANNGYGWGN
jgi:hypothetical protein